MTKPIIRVLLVEDDEDDYIITQEYLAEITRADYQLDWISSYQEALDVMLKCDHDIYLVDYRLGPHSGLDLSKKILESKCNKPIILFTGQGGLDVDLEAMESGVEDYLVKGKIDSQILERTIRYAIERSREKERLQESEARYRSLFEFAQDCILIFDEYKTIINANPAAANMLGYDHPDALIGMAAKDICYDTDQEREFFKTLYTEDSVGSKEYKMRRKDGSVLHTLGSASMHRDDEGNITRIEGVFTDITERIQIEMMLRETAERNRVFIDESPIIIFQYDIHPPMPLNLPIDDQIEWLLHKTILVEANEAHVEFAQVSRDELIGSSIFQGFGSQDLAGRSTVKTFIDRGYHLQNYESFDPVFNGEDRWILQSISSVIEGNQLIRILGTNIDITDRKNAEEKIRVSEEDLKRAQQVAQLGSWKWNTKSNKMEMSEELYVILGLDPQEGPPPFDPEGSMIHPDDIDYVKDTIQNSLKKGNPYSLDYRIYRKNDGSLRHLHVETQVDDESSQGDLIIYGTVQDITDRKKTADALHASENRYRTLFEHSVEGISILQGPKYIDVNKAWERMFGYTKDQVLGKTPYEFSPTLQPDGQVSEIIGREYLKQVAEGMDLSFDWRHTKSDGTEFDVEVLMTMIDVAGEDVQISFLRDITERKQYETTLKRQLDELHILQMISSICLEYIDENETISKVTSLIGENFYPDHFGVLLLDDSREVLTVHPSYQGLASDDYDLEIKLGEGITGQVAKNNHAIRINDVSEIKDYIAPSITHHSELCVPISINGTVYGVINAESKKPTAFSSDDERLLTTVADQLALALQKSRLFEEERQRRLIAEANREASTVLTSSLDLDDVLDNILNNLRKVIRSDFASIHLFENNHIKIVAGHGFNVPDEVIGFTYPFNNQLALDIYEAKTALVLDDVKEDPRFQNFGLLDTRGWMGIPLIEQDEVIGYLTIDSNQPGTYTQEDADQVQTFANNVAGAIVKARLFEEEKKRRLEAEIQQEISSIMANSLDLDTVLNSALLNLQRYLDYDSAGIMLQENGHMRVVAVRGFENPDDLTNKLVSVNHQLYQEIKKTKSVLIVDDIRQDSRFEDFGADIEIRGWMGVPLIDQGRVIGYISFDSQETKKFSAEMGRLAQVLVNQTATAITKAKLFEDTQLGLKRLEALHEIDRIITSSVELNFAIKQIMQVVVSQLMVDAASVVMYEPNSLTFTPINSVGFRTTDYNQRNLFGNGYASKVALMRKTIRIEDQEEIFNHYNSNEGITQEGFSSYVGVPLIAKGEIKGVLELFHRSQLNTTSEWDGFLETLATQLAIAIDNSQMFENLQRSNLELTLSYDATIEGWAKTLELRDQETQGHSERVTAMTVKLAREMGMTEEELIHVRRGALLHDVGKIGIPDSILQKPGALNEEERKVMEEHPSLAYNVLSGSVFLEKALNIPYSHHEKWDGSGYPRQLSGDQIPLPARVFAVIDVYDALRSDRPYREAWSKKKTIQYIKEESGSHFDPKVVEVFLELVDNDPDFNVY